jgi:hypothetical protein
MYPQLYNSQPAYANTPYGVVPMLTFREDLPGLALGYQLPAIRLAITIAKQPRHKGTKHKRTKQRTKHKAHSHK